MKRPYYLNKISSLCNQFPAVCLLGPRQVGKTTLARDYANQTDHLYTGIHFFDLEDPTHWAMLQQPKLILEKLEGLIIIDEIQRLPNLFPLLRVLIDKPNNKQQWLILGSASRDLLNQSSETLAGRIAYLEIQPFSYQEAQNTKKLWLYGGFPGSYLANNDTMSFEWRKQYVKTFLEQDIPNLGIQIPAMQLRRFWMMLAHYHGNILNIEELARSLSLSSKNIRYYLDMLAGTFMIRLLQPWWINISKRQVKSPKLYIRDSGLLHYLLDIENEDILFHNPKLGASWEGYAIEEVMRCKHIDMENCYFWATHQQAELDFLYFKHGKCYGFEFKFTDAPKLTKSMQIALEDLQLEKIYVVYPGNKTYLLHEKIEAIGLDELLNLDT